MDGKNAPDDRSLSKPVLYLAARLIIPLSSRTPVKKNVDGNNENMQIKGWWRKSSEGLRAEFCFLLSWTVFFILMIVFLSDHCKQAMMLLAGTEDDFLVFREKTISTFFVLESGKKCCVRKVSFWSRATGHKKYLAMNFTVLRTGWDRKDSWETKSLRARGSQQDDRLKLSFWFFCA